jgi:hypothetical protein
MSEDYSELLDKEVKVIEANGLISYTGIVIGIDFDIGITIINKEDKDDYLLCYLGETVQPAEDEEEKELYNRLFSWAVEAIRQGVMDFKESNEISFIAGRRPGNDPSSDFCAFNR